MAKDKNYSTFEFTAGPKAKEDIAKIEANCKSLDELQLTLECQSTKQKIVKLKKLYKDVMWLDKNTGLLPDGFESAIDWMRTSRNKSLKREGNKIFKQVAAYKAVQEKWRDLNQRNDNNKRNINKITRKLQAGYELYHNAMISEITANHSNSAQAQAAVQASKSSLAAAQKKDANYQNRKREHALTKEADKADEELKKHRVNGKKSGQSDAEYKSKEESLKREVVEKRSKTSVERNRRKAAVNETNAYEAKERLETLIRNQENMSEDEYQRQFEKLDGEYQALRMKTSLGRHRRRDTVNVSEGMDIPKEDIVHIAVEQLKVGNFHVPSKDDVRSKESLRRCEQFKKLYDTGDAKKIAAIFD